MRRSFRSIREQMSVLGLALASTLAMSACDDATAPDGDGVSLVPAELVGEWLLDDFGTAQYLAVRAGRVEILQQQTGFECFTRDVYDVTSTLGDVYLLQTVTGRLLPEIQLRRSGEFLSVQINADGELYTRSPDPVDSLPICDGAAPAEVRGWWTHETSHQPHYLRITAGEFEVHVPVAEGCYHAFAISLHAIEGNPQDGLTVYGRERRSGDAYQYSFRLEGDSLVRSHWVYAHDADGPDLPICPPGRGGGADDVDCSSLPELALDSIVEGWLQETDPFAQDRPFDLYRLELSEATTVRIDMTSLQVDPYLFLYTADGVYIGDDDDGGPGLDARLVRTLEAGCYRVEASTAVDFRGQYVVSATGG